MQKLINKKGIHLNETMELILGVAVVIILLLMIVLWYWPSFDETKETTKSYKNILEEQLRLAKQGQLGEIYLWPLPDDEDQTAYYIVNFAGTFKLQYNEKITLEFEGKRDEYLCVCSHTTFSECKQCLKIEENLRLEGKNGPWAFGEEQPYHIIYQEGEYLFSSNKNTLLTQR